MGWFNHQLVILEINHSWIGKYTVDGILQQWAPENPLVGCMDLFLKNESTYTTGVFGGEKSHLQLQDGGITPRDGGITPIDGGITPINGGITPIDSLINVVSWGLD